MPEIDRGVAVAYCDPPGAARAGPAADDVLRGLADAGPDWTASAVASFYREYNDHMLHDLTVHEAMPGHYLQLAHANRFTRRRWCGRCSGAARSSRAGRSTPSS